MRKFFVIILSLLLIVPARADSADEYALYLRRLTGVKTVDEIIGSGFTTSADQIFEAEFDNFGHVKVIPAIDNTYGRLILFISDMDGNILYRTEDFESNHIRPGELHQNNYKFQAIAFFDLNHDGKRDISIVGLCKNLNGDMYKTGDVLFQSDIGFYRDWRISDKINRYDMNKGVFMIAAYVRDGFSTEFLYTAKTLDELLANGFALLEYDYELILDTSFENFGDVKVVCGTYFIADHFVFLTYLINDEGQILWNFQPSNKYDNFSYLRGISFPDVNGDGLNDIVFVTRNINLSQNWSSEVVDDFAIYYQKTGYFEEDQAFRKSVDLGRTKYELSEIVDKAREFWQAAF